MYLSGTKYCSLLFCCIMSLSLSAKDAVPVVGQGLQKPLSFIENKGQITDRSTNTRSDVQYKLSTPGMSLFVSNGRLSYQFKKTEGTPGQNATTTIHSMNMTLLGANSNAGVSSLEEQAYYENYYTAGTGDGITAHAYNRIVYSNVYPNIDWVLYVKNGKVEYDFVVRPGGDISRIKMQYGGATALSITADGSIAATTPMGSVEEKAPYAYETATGRRVAANFKMQDNIVSFEAGSYNGSLTIDPYLAWSTYWGGLTEDVATCVKTDAAGNVYVGGYSNSNTGVASGAAPPQNLTYAGGYDAFIAKFNIAGTIVAASYFGGTGDDIGTSITIDNTGGGIYLGGYTASTTGIATGVYHPAYSGGAHDGFLAKFSNTCSRTWSTYYGGAGDDYVRAVACDATNNVYITGQTSSPANIASSATVYQPALSGTQDAFVAKFSTAGAVSYSTYYGGTAIEDANGITVDAANNAIITGQTNSIVGIAGTGAYQTALSGTNDAFIAKLNATGTTRSWGTYFGGTGTEQGRGIVCNTTTGAIALIGYTTSTAAIATGTNIQQAAYGGGAQDAFIAYFTTAGALSWSTYYGGTNLDFGEAICLDPAKNIIIAGGTFSTTGIASTGSYQAALGGSYDAYVAKFTPLGQRMWGSYYGNTLYDYAFGVACNTQNQIVIVGHTSSTTGIATTGAAHTAYGGGTYDAFIAQFKTDTFVSIPQPYTDTLLCAGGTFNLPYTVNFAFQPGNTFTAKLYNAAGSYIGDIGIVTATASGTITGTIPAFAPAGTGYRIRIVSSSPAYTSPDDYKDITIVTTLPHTVATASTPVCVGNTLYLHDNTDRAITSYAWYSPATTFIAATQNPSLAAVTLADAGTYSVITTHNGCPQDVATVNVVVNSTIPAAPTASASATNCIGGTISLSATEATGSAATYTWSGPAGFTSTLQNPTITGVTAANAGTYTVRDTVGGCQSTTTTVNVTVTGTVAATVSITVSPNDTVCGGTLVTFTAASVNEGISPTYQWMNGGFPIVGAASSTWSSASIITGSAISVVMHSDAVCPSPANPVSNAIPMTIITNEPIVHISATPGISVAPGNPVIFRSLVYNVGVGPTYQWQRNSVDIPGATTDTFTIDHVTTFDTIRLVVTSTMNCASTNFGISNSLVAHPNTGVANVSSSLDNVNLFPNPNTGSFTVTADLQGTGISNVGIEVLNTLGQVIWKDNAALLNNLLNRQISLGNLPNGIYLLQVSSEGRSKTVRFTIQH